MRAGPDGWIGLPFREIADKIDAVLEGVEPFSTGTMNGPVAQTCGENQTEK